MPAIYRRPRRGKLNQRETILNSNWKMIRRHCSPRCYTPFFVWMHCRKDSGLISVHTLNMNLNEGTTKDDRIEEKNTAAKNMRTSMFLFSSGIREPRAGSQNWGHFFLSFFHLLLFVIHSRLDSYSLPFVFHIVDIVVIKVLLVVEWAYKFVFFIRDKWMMVFYFLLYSPSIWVFFSESFFLPLCFVLNFPHFFGVCLVRWINSLNFFFVFQQSIESKTAVSLFRKSCTTSNQIKQIHFSHWTLISVESCAMILLSILNLNKTKKAARVNNRWHIPPEP